MSYFKGIDSETQIRSHHVYIYCIYFLVICLVPFFVDI